MIQDHKIVDLFKVGLGVYLRSDSANIENEKRIVENQHYLKNCLNDIGSEFYLLEHESLRGIKDFCQASLDNYYNGVLGYEEKIEISISWSNRTKSKEMHHNHSHPNSIISGVFYFDPIEESPITFTSPLNPYICLKGSRTNENPYNADESTILGKNKNFCILFPSYLKHQVEINMSEKTRYSIAFNSFFKAGQVINGSASQLKL